MSKASAPYPPDEAPPVYQTYTNGSAPPPMPNQPPPSTIPPPSSTYPAYPTHQPTVTYLQPNVVTVQPGRTTIIINNALGPYPTTVNCTQCHMACLTETYHEAGVLTWVIAGVLFIFGMWLCCCLPFCIDSCQDVEHRCSNCKKYIGTYKRM